MTIALLAPQDEKDKKLLKAIETLRDTPTRVTSDVTLHVTRDNVTNYDLTPILCRS